MNSTITNTDVGIDAIVIYIGLLAFSLTISFIATGILVYDQPVEIPLSYDLKYYDMFAELDDTELADVQKKNLKNIFIKDTTDEGEDIILCYNADIGAFQIWSNKTIPFLTLDSLAQLYAIVNNCKCVCIDYRNEVVEAIVSSKPPTTNILKDIKIKSSPFASFKKYNTKDSKSSSSRVYSIPEKCNHFRRVGKIEDWDKKYKDYGHWIDSENSKSWVHDKLENDPLHNTTKFSYSDWKTKK
jgi:hypothetical protein